MPKYEVYINAGIEINQTIDAESEEVAIKKAYLALSEFSIYECHDSVNKIESTSENL